MTTREACSLLREIADERVRDVWVLYRMPDGRWEYSYCCTDLTETLFELRTAAINTRAEVPEEPA